MASFLDDINVLSVRLVPESNTAGTRSAESQESALQRTRGNESSVNSTDLTFLTNEPGQTLRERFGVLLRMIHATSTVSWGISS